MIKVSYLSKNFPKFYWKIFHILCANFVKLVDFFQNHLLIFFKKNFRSCSSDTEDFFQKRNRIVQEYIRGIGIEIGALHNPVPIPANVTVKYVDRLSVESLRHQYPELKNLPLVDVDIIANGETLDSIEENSQDFVVANHFLEHCQNPLLAIKNMFRVLKKNGILYMAIPDKRYSFDITRPITSYQHLVEDYTRGSEISKKEHFEEWVKLVCNVTDNYEVTRQVNELMRTDYSIHFHVWTQVEMIELVLNIKKKLEFEVELICRNIGEVIFVLERVNYIG